MGTAFDAYIKSLNAGAVAASEVYTADRNYYNARSMAQLIKAASSTAVGGNTQGVLGSGAGVASGIIIPATDAGVIAGMEAVAGLTNTVINLILVSPIRRLSLSYTVHYLKNYRR
jgi:hypothetical protein